MSTEGPGDDDEMSGEFLNTSSNDDDDEDRKRSRSRRIHSEAAASLIDLSKGCNRSVVNSTIYSTELEQLSSSSVERSLEQASVNMIMPLFVVDGALLRRSVANRPLSTFDHVTKLMTSSEVIVAKPTAASSSQSVVNSAEESPELHLLTPVDLFTALRTDKHFTTPSTPEAATVVDRDVNPTSPSVNPTSPPSVLVVSGGKSRPVPCAEMIPVPGRVSEEHVDECIGGKFVCPVCKKSFSQNHQLTMHKNVHYLQKAYRLDLNIQCMKNIAFCFVIVVSSFF